MKETLITIVGAALLFLSSIPPKDFYNPPSNIEVCYTSLNNAVAATIYDEESKLQIGIVISDEDHVAEEIKKVVDNAPLNKRTIRLYIRERIKEEGIGTQHRNVKPFIEKFGVDFVMEGVEMNISPAIKAAQGGLESAWGTSYLFRTYNAMYGVKAGKRWMSHHTAQGASERVRDKVENSNDKYLRFNSPWWSIRNHSYVLCGSYYNLQGRHWRMAADHLQRRGYATGKHYRRKLVNLIEQYDFYKLDEIAEEVKHLQEQQFVNN